MCFGIRILSPFHLGTLQILIQNKLDQLSAVSSTIYNLLMKDFIGALWGNWELVIALHIPPTDLKAFKVSWCFFPSEEAHCSWDPCEWSKSYHCILIGVTWSKRVLYWIYKKKHHQLKFFWTKIYNIFQHDNNSLLSPSFYHLVGQYSTLFSTTKIKVNGGFLINRSLTPVY